MSLITYFHKGNLMRVITGLFNDQISAENADKTLSESGYRSSEIDVIMSEEARQKYFGKATTLETEVGYKAAEGAAIGGVIAGIIGAFIGWGMPEDLLKEYEQRINNGGILIGVRSKSEADANRFEKDWKNMHRDPM